jgi:hypothetical protein
VKGVLGPPHVLAAAGDGVTPLVRVESDGAGVQHRTHVTMVFKDPQRRGGIPIARRPTSRIDTEGYSGEKER